MFLTGRKVLVLILVLSNSPSFAETKPRPAPLPEVPHDDSLPSLPVSIELPPLPRDDVPAGTHPTGAQLPRHWDAKCTDAAGTDYYLVPGELTERSNSAHLVVVHRGAPPEYVEVPEPTTIQPPESENEPSRALKPSYRGPNEWASHYGPWKNGKTTLFIDSIAFNNSLVTGASCVAQDPEQKVEFHSPTFDDYVYSLSEGILDRSGDDMERIVRNVERFAKSPFRDRHESDYLLSLTAMLGALPGYDFSHLKVEAAKLKASAQASDRVTADYLSLAIRSVSPLTDAERAHAMVTLGLSRARKIEPPELFDHVALRGAGIGMERFVATATAAEKKKLAQELLPLLVSLSPEQVKDFGFFLSDPARQLLVPALASVPYRAARQAQQFVAELKAKPHDPDVLRRLQVSDVKRDDEALAFLREQAAPYLTAEQLAALDRMGKPSSSIANSPSGTIRR